ncbi:MAG: cold shock domain-containing protein [Candidatus Hadarchaeota archaeon]|nr:cold shock domain-containing protein [Candidatus Hadarchaeota archaeon]
MEGTVKFFDDRKNYGFISPDGESEDLFVHRNDIESTLLEREGSPLNEGDRVKFGTEQTEKGSKAVRVEKI